VIFAISGDVDSGKTTFLKRLTETLADRRGRLAGFLNERVFERGAVAGYDLVDLGSAKRTAWLRRGAAGERIGGFAIVPEGLAAAAAIIRRSDPSGLLVIDELGPAELEGRGFWPFVRPLLDETGRSFLFVIRTECLADFGRLFSGRPMKIFSVGGTMAPGDVAREVLSHAGQG
jgi:nucleoside-triphosphatase THEP1